jgi:hypothetical protein
MAATFFISVSGCYDGGFLIALIGHQPMINLQHLLQRQTIINIFVFTTDTALGFALSHGLEAT